VRPVDATPEAVGVPGVVGVYVAGKGFAFQVHEPPELVEHIRALAVLLAAAAKTG
jgi:hypothetical protein